MTRRWVQRKCAWCREPFDRRATECERDGEWFCPQDVRACWFEHNDRMHGGGGEWRRQAYSEAPTA